MNEKLHILKGEPFSFQDMNYLLPIYRETHQRIIVMKAHKPEMAERMVGWLLQKVTTSLHTIGVACAVAIDIILNFVFSLTSARSQYSAIFLLSLHLIGVFYQRR